jgi:hypothetical protein
MAEKGMIYCDCDDGTGQHGEPQIEWHFIDRRQAETGLLVGRLRGSHATQKRLSAFFIADPAPRPLLHDCRRPGRAP